MTEKFKHEVHGKRFWLFVAFTLLSTVACAPSGWNKESRIDHALLVGYGTICGSSIQFAGSGEKATASKQIVKAGQQTLVLVADSGPDAEIDPVSPEPNYRCSWITQHDVAFDAKASKVYRFYLDRQHSGEYLIRVLEGDEFDQVEMTQVPSESQQTKAIKHCRFYWGC